MRSKCPSYPLLQSSKMSSSAGSTAAILLEQHQCFVGLQSQVVFARVRPVICDLDD